MQTSTKSNASYEEDKKCRICGVADVNNINIFTSISGNTLIRKILAVYPIVMYSTDPLPKNICKKCIYNVNLMYTDIQRVLKTQRKWTDNVRRNQPTNDYVRILDLIENSSDVTRQSIRTVFAVDIQRVPSRAVPSESLNSVNLVSVPTNKGVLSTRVEVNGSAFLQIQKSLNIQNTDNTKIMPPPIKELKTMLALNGCTLRPLVEAQLQNPDLKCKANDEHDEAKVETEIKSENSAKNLAYANIPTTSTQCKEKEPSSGVKCRYCHLMFDSQPSLATHQLLHMRLHIPRLFDKKYLHKKLRKGRVITVQERKCIRCLNCWRLFVDNKSILNHWSWGECDFYCHICGDEFPTSPKMLRDHVPLAHGISYRSSKITRTPLTTLKTTATPEVQSDYKLYKAVSEEEPLPNENVANRNETTKAIKNVIQKQFTKTAIAAVRTSAQTTKGTSAKKSKRKMSSDPFSSVACNICHKTFHNFKARNSHMRKHKPSHLYGDIVLPPHRNRDGYHNVDPQVQRAAANKTKKQTHSATTSKSVTRAAGHERKNCIAAANAVTSKFVTRQVNMNTKSGIRIRSITEMQKTSPNRPIHPDVITAKSTSCLNSWLAASGASTSSITHEVKEEPIDFDSI